MIPRRMSSKRSEKKPAPQVTQKTIAENLGIDQSTVSACLNNAPRAMRYTQELRDKIQQEAERLSYRPHFFASQMRSSHPKIVLLCLSNFVDAHAAAVGMAFTEQAGRLGYHVIVSSIDKVENPAENIRAIIGPQGIHAMCLISTALNIFPSDELSSLLDDGVKIVLALRSHPDPRVMQVTVDDETSARMAYEYLWKRGFRNVWVLHDSTSITSETVGNRAAAFVRAAADSGGPEPLLIPIARPQGGGEIIPGEAETKEMLSRHGAPDAIFAVRDMLAYGAVNALNSAGYKVGQDVSVIGHDDIWPSKLFSPPLTTVRQPLERIGSTAADLLIDALQNETPEKRAVEFRSTIIERASVGLAVGSKEKPGAYTGKKPSSRKRPQN